MLEVRLTSLQIEPDFAGCSTCPVNTHLGVLLHCLGHVLSQRKRQIRTPVMYVFV